MTISITTINIGATSKERAEQFTNWFDERGDDVYVITEASGGEGTARLLDRFRDAGYQVATNGNFGPERGVAIISRIPFRTDQLAPFVDVTIPCRAAAVVLDTQPALSLVGLYIPSRDASADKVERKKSFLESLQHALRALPAVTRSSIILGGDYNVVSRTHLPKYSTFLKFEYDLFDTLSELGLGDTHMALHPGDQPHSWVGRTGDGYRYDYFHAGGAVLPLVKSSEYLSTTRDSKLTDHSAVRLEIDAKADRLETRGLRDSSAQTLFDF
ncbi:endonuclease/exonuclease/phosphatase family protein [Microbacterium aurum]|uniref:endonuclease/exonuclease/phosphatase family protein n=1 Tax=Microbacterium aurum TaxID=36805 RepID=UPI0018DB6693|nr:endonuclease/exonuclease/phosphatase family protein [Microbacterium aurum]MBM7826316.1 exodeoxyribonuclease-3 [Microbacterium aurum]